jgi:hypothetical protein
LNGERSDGEKISIKSKEVGYKNNSFCFE